VSRVSASPSATPPTPGQGRDLRHNGGVDVVLANLAFGPVREGKGFQGLRPLRIQQGLLHPRDRSRHALARPRGMKDDGRGVALIGGINKLAKTKRPGPTAYNAKAKREFFKVLFDR